MKHPEDTRRFRFWFWWEVIRLAATERRLRLVHRLTARHRANCNLCIHGDDFMDAATSKL